MMAESSNKYQVMPPLSDEEYQALKESIAERGVELPLVLDAEGNVIDGHHRMRAVEELRGEGRSVADPITITRSDLETDEDKRDEAWRLNMQRRHLNELQKRGAIAAKLKESPRWADNRIAQLLGVDGKTVRSERTSLEIRKEIPKEEMLEGKDGKFYPRNRTGDLEAELAVTKTDGVRQDIWDVGTRWLFEHASEERRQERTQEIATKWGVSAEHVEDQAKSLVERGPRLKDLGEEKREEVLAEAFTATFGTGRQIKAGAVRDKMRDLADLVTGYEGKKSEADPEAVAEAVVGYYMWVNSGLGVGRFDENQRSQVRTDVRRYKLLVEWIERFVPLLEEKLEKRLTIERDVSELRQDLQEEEGINPPPP
jgi:ParB-like chromosome segregation protein Spo0J